MRLKTYTAPDLTSALAAARGEMGADALVLGTRKVAGRFGLEAVEVTVASSVDSSKAVSPPADIAGLALGLGSLGRCEPDDAATDPSPLSDSDREDPSDPGVPAVREAVRGLVGCGLSQDLALRFARIALRDLRPSDAARDVARAAEKAMAALVPFAPLPVRSRCLFVVGPPGSGKTTTVAKIAARLALAGRREVVLAEADSDRIGSLEQAGIYARHIGARLDRIESPEDLRRSVAASGHRGAVIVDTPGVSARDVRRTQMLSALREAVPDAEVAVIVPCGLHRDEASRVLRRFSVLRPTCAGFSRVDDGERLGELVTALERSGLPLSFVTTGHHVPGDLESASPAALAGFLLRGASDTARRMEVVR